ncbi:uncharacterized protein LOC131693315 [Topomyia yanbarensis]|uniref:uncharacterized protein LOC131693315 n=1 Tax=Topomyia yanbarensis TaxID=2498891 RepID=UPI00273CC327|nr:uncharacterized protein LOC131693315 [Topomyia yanbarensis]
MCTRAIVTGFVTIIIALVAVKAQWNCAGPPPSASPKICCPWMDGGTTYNDTIYVMCWERYSIYPLIPVPGGGYAGGPAGCAAECLFNYLGVLDINHRGTLINKPALVRHVQEISDPERYPFMYESLNYCVDEANRRYQIFGEIQQRDPVISGLDNCNPISGFAMSCMHAYSIRFCPDWTPNDEEGCDDLLDFYNQCPLNPY